MIIRAIRLKDIKSYGAGADGAGVTVEFAPGINRIAGRNGHGKSTLIEALGYALFLTEPVFEENFDIATYLLRHGCKCGEIDVAFDADGARYRVERGVGVKSPRRSKVVDELDGSIAAEGDAEVAAFLCRLLHASDAARLGEWFAKLAGVKQGRLTWPFDSKPAEARKHFEPLLDVEIFRQCFDRLKPVADRFDALRAETATQLAVIEERIRERAESPAKAETAARQVGELGAKTKAAQNAKDAAEAIVKQHEAKDAAQRGAERARDEAARQCDLAKQHHDNAAQRVRETGEAADNMARSKPAHDVYAAAEAAAQALLPKQEKRAALREQRAEQQRKLALLDEQAAAAGRRAGDFATEAAKKSAEVETRRTRLAGDRTAITADGASAQEAGAVKRVESLASRIAATEQQRTTLAEQLRQIAGGLCPFLKEQCRQFDAAKVQADVGAFDAALPSLRADLDIAREEARRCQIAAKQLAAKRAQLDVEEQALAALASEIESLRERAAGELKTAEQRKGDAAAVRTELEKLDAAILGFGDLDGDARRSQKAKEEHAGGYRAFLAAKPVADDLAPREKSLGEAAASRDTAAKTLAIADAALATARKDFDPAALAAARIAFTSASDELAAGVRDLVHARAVLDAEKNRVAELEKARGAEGALKLTIQRHEAASALVGKARKILRDAAPHVAQHLCDRIAARAQRIFNRINHEPAELEWSSERYSLRVEPGDRRFAMLSGGEQTKLALAMTLAQIDELSGLRFCLFDEPTYGVDAESRSRLAEAIVEAQETCGFDQLLVVSHDNAFDGKIEHTVLLKKTASGTTVADAEFGLP